VFILTQARRIKVTPINTTMWKFTFAGKADINILYILLFGAVGLCLIYGIDFIYRKIRKKP